MSAKLQRSDVLICFCLQASRRSDIVKWLPENSYIGELLTAAVKAMSKNYWQLNGLELFQSVSLTFSMYHYILIRRDAGWNSKQRRTAVKIHKGMW